MTDRYSIAGSRTGIGHPFAATGARILSQAVSAMGPGRRGIVSVCADGGQGTVVLAESV